MCPPTRRAALRAMPALAVTLSGCSSLGDAETPPAPAAWTAQIDESLPGVQFRDGPLVIASADRSDDYPTVAADRPSISISRAQLSPARVPLDSTVTVTATVVNDGARAGTSVADLLVDGGVVDSQAIVVPAESSRQVAFRQRFGEEGTYEIRVKSVLAGRLEVINESSGELPGNGSSSGPPSTPRVTPAPPTGPPSPPTPTPTPAPTAPPPTTESESGGIFDLSDIDGPAALALSGMIVFVILGFLYYIRRRFRDDAEEETETDERPAEDDGPTVGDGGHRRDG